MPLKDGGRATDFRETDRRDGGVGWIAHPDETMRRASHALAVDGDVWLVDPLDCAGLDDLIAPFGDIAGTVVLLDRHTRDADAIASRHGVSVHLPRPLSGVADDIDARTETFGDTLADTGYRAFPVVDNPLWREVSLYDADSGTLVVPEAVGTVDYYRTGTERLGVHPMLRALPPRDALGGLSVDRLLVGHGQGVSTDADGALGTALQNARRTAPKLYLQNAKDLLPV